MLASFASEAEAKKAAVRFRKQIPGRVTFAHVLDEYEQHLAEKGNKQSSIKVTTWRLNNWLEPEMPIADVTPTQTKRRYEKRCKVVSVDTHRGELSEVKTFWRWVVKKGYVTRSPAEKIEPVGRRRKGKLQLRRSEARAFFVKALELARQGDEGAVAALAVLVLGLRSGEIWCRRVRDVDADEAGALLWIEEGKTEAATRYMEVPDPLAGLLVDRTSLRRQEEWLFPSQKAASGHRESGWLRSNVKRICEAAVAPVVTVHGLRGTWATLTTDAGVSGHVVARELGHTNETVTREHYTEHGAEDRAKARRMIGLLVDDVAGERERGARLVTIGSDNVTSCPGQEESPGITWS